MSRWRSGRSAADGAAEAIVGTFGERAAPFGPDDLRDAVDAMLARLLEVGVVAGPAAHAQTIFRARAAADAAGAVHLALGLDALADQIEAYEARSARHDELACLALPAELHARPRAADRTATLVLVTSPRPLPGLLTDIGKLDGRLEPLRAVD